MASQAEQIVGRSLRTILAGVPNGESIADSEHLRDLLSGMEFFIPEVLRDFHHEWYADFLDDFIPVVARKTGEQEAEFLGLCILISDQTLTPIHLRLQVSRQATRCCGLSAGLAKKGTTE
jgi:hypothetical protein